MRMMYFKWLTRVKSLWAKRQYNRLTIEITCILMVKLALLWLLWSLCFSHPVKKVDRQEAVTKIILNKP